jgi:nitrate/nitrite transport system substrate-binding protein
VLYGLVYGVHLGIGGPKKDMAVLMTLNNNGQAITLSKKLADKGAVDGAGLAKLMASDKREYTFAQTFPTGTHAMWLYYWMAANGIDPMKGAKVITVPPPQMVANMRVGNMDGYCVGEPWNHRAIIDGIGITATTTQDIWKDHPEKGAGHHRRLRQEVPQHLPRRDRRDHRGRPLDRCQPGQQEQDGRDDRRQEPTSTPAWTPSTSASWGATRTAWARPGTTPTT